MDIFIVGLRIFLAALLGAIIGIEREIKNRAAGFRTHIIVSIGAWLIMLIGIDGFGQLSTDTARDTARLAGQVVSGIGFLGAGTILQRKDGVSGLTTAATLWLSAAIGLAVGIGYYDGAIIATIICLVTLISLKGLSNLINKRVTQSYKMVFDSHNFDQENFQDFISKRGVEVRKLDIINENKDDELIMEVTFSFHKNYNIGRFIKRLKADFQLKSVELMDDYDWHD